VHELKDKSKPIVLVTGATGLVGRELVHCLVGSGSYYVRGVARSLTTELPCDLCSLEINGATEWGEVLAGIDVVVHCAAITSSVKGVTNHQTLIETNVVATRVLAEQAAAAGVKRFIFISSLKVNGEHSSTNQKITSKDQAEPQDLYAESKFQAENDLTRIACTTGMELVIVRPPLVYGPGVKGNFEALMRLCASGIPLPFALANKQRSMVYTKNLADLLLRCIESPNAAGKVFLVSDGYDMTTSELVARIRIKMGIPPRLFPIPVYFFRIIGWCLRRSGVVERLFGELRLDLSESERDLGYKAPYAIDEALENTVNTYLVKLTGSSND
jgi:nucleoside-diphosphate-sugar epimerase